MTPELIVGLFTLAKIDQARMFFSVKVLVALLQ